MTRIGSGVLLAAALGISSGAQAGGFGIAVDAPPPVAPEVVPSTGLTWGGVVSASIGQMSFENTDDSFELSEDTAEDGLRTFTLDGQLQMNYNGFYGLLDASQRRRDIGDEEFDEYAPSEVTAYGVHLGRSFGAISLGAFYGQNRFDAYDGSENTTESGRLYGLELGVSPTENVLLFGQAGRAEMIGEEDDTAFDGNFYRIGASADLGRVGVTVDAERGQSPDIFEDDEDEGDYTGFGVAVDYDFTDRLSGNLGVETLDVNANDEDWGGETTISLGVSYAFGGAQNRSPMNTTWRPGLAAAWAEALD